MGTPTTNATIETHDLAHQGPAMGQSGRHAGITDGNRSVGARPLAGAPAGGETTLSPVVEGLLRDVAADGFVVYCCGPRAAPRALVASYQWEDYVDLVSIRCFERVIAARVPAAHRGRVDVFAPEVVVWAYEGPPQYALPALLNLVHPQHPEAPVGTYPAPPSLHIPRAEQRPMTIRLPPPGRAEVRAHRLKAAIATPIPAQRHRRTYLPL